MRFKIVHTGTLRSPCGFPRRTSYTRLSINCIAHAPKWKPAAHAALGPLPVHTCVYKLCVFPLSTGLCVTGVSNWFGWGSENKSVPQLLLCAIMLCAYMCLERICLAILARKTHRHESRKQTKKNSPGAAKNVVQTDSGTIRILYSAFRQKFPKLWTSIAHSFLQQLAQNKNWAHPKLLPYPEFAKWKCSKLRCSIIQQNPNLGAFWGVFYVIVRQNYSIPDVLSKLAERTGAYSQYAWSGCRRSADVTRADHDRVGWSQWQGG